MKRSCKNIDITDIETVLPWVIDCVMRHKRRYDFRNLLVSVGHLPSEDYYEAIDKQDYSSWSEAFHNIAEEATKRIKQHDLQLRPVRIQERIDRSNYKKRLIGNEDAMQQVLDHIAVNASAPIWERRFVPQQASSLRYRGPDYGSRIIRKWLKKDNAAAQWAAEHNYRYNRACKYFVKLDVRHCYPSLRTEVFMKFFKKDCGNIELLWLWETLLNSHKINGNEGFMIGALVSQFACQYLLSFAYRYVMGLHKERGGKQKKIVKHALFYMDDQLLIGSSRRDLRAAVKALVKFEQNELGLTIKENWFIQETANHPIDMMGYVHYADGHVSIRSRIYLRARRQALRIRRRGCPSIEQARRLCSYKGYFKHTQTYTTSEKLKLKQLFKESAAIVSRHEKERKHGRKSVFSHRAGSYPVYAFT